MTELIKISTGPRGQSVVSARELHAFLNVKQQFQDWIKNRIRRYGFLQDRDYVEVEGFSKNLEKPAQEVFHKSMKNPLGHSNAKHSTTFSENLGNGSYTIAYAPTRGIAGLTI